jgi:hypothetical protein
VPAFSINNLKAPVCGWYRESRERYKLSFSGRPDSWLNRCLNEGWGGFIDGINEARTCLIRADWGGVNQAIPRNTLTFNHRRVHTVDLQKVKSYFVKCFE